MEKASEKEREEREGLFCHLCALLGNPREAAVRAGFPAHTADREAGLLLERGDIRKRIEKCAKRMTGGDLESLALRGLLRLAFGQANDAARLALAGEEEVNPDTLDLFLVSDIKRPKGGGVEVKLYDRAAALALLLSHAGSREDTGAGSLYKALRETARALPTEGEEHAL